jgi:hypothetical protein
VTSFFTGLGVTDDRKQLGPLAHRLVPPNAMCGVPTGPGLISFLLKRRELYFPPALKFTF